MSDIYNDPRIGRLDASRGPAESSNVPEKAYSIDNPPDKLTNACTNAKFQKTCEIASENGVGTVQDLAKKFKSLADAQASIAATQVVNENATRKQSFDNMQ